jgi:hypothetical protein
MTTPGVAPHPWVVPVVAAQCTDYQYTEGFTQGSYLEAGAIAQCTDYQCTEGITYGMLRVRTKCIRLLE